MAYLTRFPVHAIKVDRVFVDGLGRSVDSEAIVSAIVAMARALGKRVVAEGVETEAQLAILDRLGCDSIQGHLIAPACRRGFRRLREGPPEARGGAAQPRLIGRTTRVAARHASRFRR